MDRWRPGAPATDPRAAAWSRLHYGIDPSDVPLVRVWLRSMWRLAGPLVRLRVPPLAVTVAGLLCAVAAAGTAGRWPWPALALVLLAVVADGLDGAVALLAARASAFGAVADKVADRVSDVAFAVVLWRCGAPGWLALTAGALSLVHEGFRAWLRGPRLARITVAERPTRTICTVLACASAGVTSATWPPTACAAVWVGLALIGLAQLVQE